MAGEVAADVHERAAPAVAPVRGRRDRERLRPGQLLHHRRARAAARARRLPHVNLAGRAARPADEPVSRRGRPVAAGTTPDRPDGAAQLDLRADRGEPGGPGRADVRESRLRSRASHQGPHSRCGAAAGGSRDIAAITANRWPHGYTYSYNPLFDPPEWAFEAGDDRPVVTARQPFGRIAIAGADAAASPHSDAAFREAHRAVAEVLAAG